MCAAGQVRKYAGKAGKAGKACVPVPVYNTAGGINAEPEFVDRIDAVAIAIEQDVYKAHHDVEGLCLSELKKNPLFTSVLTNAETKCYGGVSEARSVFSLGCNQLRKSFTKKLNTRHRILFKTLKKYRALNENSKK